MKPLLAWRQSDFTRNVATLAGSTAVGHAFLLLASPLVSRLYTPADVGALGLLTSFIAFATLAVTLRLELGIVAAPSPAVAMQLAACAACSSASLSVLATLAFLGLVELHVLGFGSLSPWLALPVAGTVLLTGWHSTLRYLLVRLHAYGTIGRVSIWQNVTRGVVQVGLGFAGGGIWGLVTGEFAGRLSGVRTSWRQVRPTLAGTFPPLAVMLSTLRSYYRYPCLTLPSSLLDSASKALLIPLLTASYGIVFGGAFTLVSTVMAAPAALVGAAVADVYHANLAKARAAGHAQAVRLFWRTSASLAAMAAPPMAVLMLAGPALFATVFGDAWRTAGAIAQITAPWTLLQFIVVPVSRTIFVYGGQRLKLVFDGLALAAALLIPTLAQHFPSAPLTTMRVLTLLYGAAYVIYFALLRYALGRTPDRPSPPAASTPVTP
ncbi:MAG: oligosaccharide flippase family protein [Lentisphaerae bacterium]|nr:oligosaccharide flippase family protein [Lentisphaerota bacterium]